MGYKINMKTSNGIPATYAKLASYTVECSDKQYIQAIFQVYANKKCRDEGFSPFADTIEIKIELEKDFTGNLVKTIYEKAKELEIFANSEVI